MTGARHHDDRHDPGPAALGRPGRAAAPDLVPRARRAAPVPQRRRRGRRRLAAGPLRRGRGARRRADRAGRDRYDALVGRSAAELGRRSCRRPSSACCADGLAYFTLAATGRRVARAGHDRRPGLRRRARRRPRSSTRTSCPARPPASSSRTSPTTARATTRSPARAATPAGCPTSSARRCVDPYALYAAAAAGVRRRAAPRRSAPRCPPSVINRPEPLESSGSGLLIASHHGVYSPNREPRLHDRPDRAQLSGVPALARRAVVGRRLLHRRRAVGERGRIRPPARGRGAAAAVRAGLAARRPAARRVDARRAGSCAASRTARSSPTPNSASTSPATPTTWSSTTQGRAYVGDFGFDLMGGADVEPAGLLRVDPDGTVTPVPTTSGSPTAA